MAALWARKALEERDPAETWEVPYAEREGLEFFRARRGSYLSVPRSREEIPGGAVEGLWDACGLEGPGQAFILPFAVRSTGTRGVLVMTPASVLMIGPRAVGLWTEGASPGVKAVIPVGDLAAIEDVTVLLYGRLSFLAAGRRITIRYNTVGRSMLEPALLSLRRLMAGPAREVPREGDEAALSFKWRNVLAEAAARLDAGAAAAFAFQSVPGRGRGEPVRGELLLLNPRELALLREPRDWGAAYGVDSFVVPRDRVTSLAERGETLEVESRGAVIPVEMAPALRRTALSWSALIGPG
jgi:hypothetical protein